ncbi:DNA polymerase beta superfamily protein [Levilactobacillus acidifarinae]|nr:nucleotidyltransferase domain-containing protein [Levilactobacillus acidifarinae]GEO70461.1 hypothetical protein LAC03_23710 [Levilactobacillus acidifarinae]
MNYLPIKTWEYLMGKTSDTIIAVYLTGSHLNNLATKDSDVDYYVITFPRFDDLIFNRRRATQETGDVDFKMMDLFHFLNLMFKANPNVIELLYRDPLYCSDIYLPISTWLMTSRDNLPLLNPKGWEGACLGQMLQIRKRVAVGKKYEGNGSLGKDMIQFNKSYSYFMANFAHGTLEDVVNYSDPDARDAALRIKSWTNSDRGIKLNLKNSGTSRHDDYWDGIVTLDGIRSSDNPEVVDQLQIGQFVLFNGQLATVVDVGGPSFAKVMVDLSPQAAIDAHKKKFQGQKDCPYCHIDEGNEPEWNYELQVGQRLPHDGYGYPEVSIDPDSAQIYIDALDTPTLDINFCPMCGRKLN